VSDKGLQLLSRLQDLIDIPVNRSSIAKAKNGTYLPLDSYDSCISTSMLSYFCFTNARG
jgi:hypothetical protein